MSGTETASLGGALAETVERFRAGEERGLARAISLVEDERPGFEALLDELHEGVGRARRVGVTGPPGAGKSTLTASLARRFREADLTVGIIAADPTSPFTGGALLGDRIRMGEVATDPGIFIRSMASRGATGGLATASREVADLMDAFGFDRIVLETVGVGQSELEVADSADTTVVVLVPESGDGIQAMKAGLMEVADLFVVNKSDRPGADRLRKELEVMIRMRSGEGAGDEAGHHGLAPAGEPGGGGGGGAGPSRQPEAWEVPVLKTVASTGEGVDELASAVDAHFEQLEVSGQLEARRRRHLLDQARSVLLRRGRRRLEELWQEHGEAHADALVAGRMTPYRVADAVEAELEGR